MIDGTASFVAALTLGLLGSVHCAAMCGGLASAFALAIPANAPVRTRAQMLLGLSAGRILGYAVAGAVVGTLGLAVAGVLGATGAAALRALAGVALIALALVVAGVVRPAIAFERLGARVWRRLQPMAVALRHDLRAGNVLALGFLWGWLPCGLVYSALGWAATTGTPASAALVMLGFGLGTLPGVLLPTVAAFRLGTIVRAQSSRRVAAVMLAAFGLWTIVGASTMLAAARAGGACHHAIAASAVADAAR